MKTPVGQQGQECVTAALLAQGGPVSKAEHLPEET